MEAFEIAQTARSFVDMSITDEFTVQRLPEEVQMLIIKEVGFEQLAFIEYCCKPPKPVSETNPCVSSQALRMLEERVRVWDPNAVTNLKQLQ